MRLIVYFVLAIVPFAASANADDPLIYASNLQYLGGFKLPASGVDADYRGWAIAYRPASTGAPNGSIFVSGTGDKISEVGIPDQSSFSTSSNVADWPRGTLLQNATQVYGSTEIDYINTGKTYATFTVIGGLLVNGDKLLGTSYYSYGYATSQERAVWKMPLTLDNTSATGSYKPTSKAPITGGPLSRMMAGHLTPIPSAYQTALGGDTLAGLHDVSIVGQTSFGPTLFSFNTDDLTSTATPYNVTPLMYIGAGQSHPTYGYWRDDSSPSRGIMSSTDIFGGCVFPEGSRSVLFISRHGKGPQHYGQGTNILALDGTEVPGEPGVYYRYDPDEPGGKGQHNWPYVYQIIAYDVNDLIKVKNGALANYAVEPYAYWDLSLPTPKATGQQYRLGATYDSANNIIYVSQLYADGVKPIIHAFRLNLNAAKELSPSEAHAPFILNIK
jgi:hypothetical protein